MYDYLRLRADLADRNHYVENFPAEFTGTHVEATGEVIAKSYNRNFRGLKTAVYGNSIRIDGSIQKFLSGENYTDFTRSKLKRACKDLANAYLLKETDLRIYNFEASVTIEAPPIYNYMKSYRNRYMFMPMAKNNAVYGSRFTMGSATSGSKGEYGCKCYDKTQQVRIQTKEKLDKQLQHFELCVNNPQWFNNRHPYWINYLHSLYDIDVMTAVGGEMIDLFHSITFAGAELDYSSLQEFKPAQVSQIVAMSDERYAAHLKANHPETHKKYSSLYNKVRGNATYYRNVEEVAHFGEKLVEKVSYLINN
ncbi:hypothetical protein [Pontibacter akesuensis]|uniref:Uncharacterized protein n=1 Tax=Pontibacter akesuensis TaxID=388950 RepID=A0A1I7IMD0_9BACT|nr:hypothetical protein [Pontibacter akesuensis]GHA67857.1 hypothetical protein GCM10007389_21500 [Pontibacter akesuensis]SFU74083.1 hypothetical protein SAMN04487941_2321 [Pontibacter akesuensis]